MNGSDINYERRDGDQKRDNEEVGLPLPNDAKHKRPQDIKLLFNAEGPKVQKRLSIGGHIEVAGLAPQHNIRNKTRPCGGVLTEHLKFVGQQNVPTDE